jgi:hypothetical protein
MNPAIIAAAAGRLAAFAVAISLALLLPGCANQQEKPGAANLQMQSNNLAGSIQYGLKF